MLIINAAQSAGRLPAFCCFFTLLYFSHSQSLHAERSDLCSSGLLLQFWHHSIPSFYLVVFIYLSLFFGQWALALASGLCLLVSCSLLIPGVMAPSPTFITRSTNSSLSFGAAYPKAHSSWQLFLSVIRDFGAVAGGLQIRVIEWRWLEVKCSKWSGVSSYSLAMQRQ